jgi:phage baseplate assembly protein W
MAEVVYSDIDFKFRILPSSGDLNLVTEEKAINQSLISLFFTKKGERMNNPEFGTGIPFLQFEPLDRLTGQEIATEIQNAVSIWEGNRITLKNLEVTIKRNDNSYRIFLEYIIKITAETGSLEFFLEKT